MTLRQPEERRVESTVCFIGADVPQTCETLARAGNRHLSECLPVSFLRLDFRLSSQLRLGRFCHPCRA